MNRWGGRRSSDDPGAGGIRGPVSAFVITGSRWPKPLKELHGNGPKSPRHIGSDGREQRCWWGAGREWFSDPPQSVASDSGRGIHFRRGQISACREGYRDKAGPSRPPSNKASIRANTELHPLHGHSTIWPAPGAGYDENGRETGSPARPSRHLSRGSRTQHN